MEELSDKLLDIEHGQVAEVTGNGINDYFLAAAADNMPVLDASIIGADLGDVAIYGGVALVVGLIAKEVIPFAIDAYREIRDKINGP